VAGTSSVPTGVPPFFAEGARADVDGVGCGLAVALGHELSEQVQVASIVDVSPNTVHLVEAVRNDPGCRLWEAFADQAK